MDIISEIITVINIVTNAVGKYVFSLIAILPGWLSNTIIAAIVGPLLLVVYKYTSNQTAIGKIKDKIKANLLALRLYKDNISITIGAEGRIFANATLLLVHSLRPMLVMIIPVSLLLAQMGLWYQNQPVKPNDKTIITVALNVKEQASWPRIELNQTPSIKVTSGPVRIFSQKKLCWEIEASKSGYNDIVFEIDDQKFKKQLAVGNGFMRISSSRPQNRWLSVLLHPAEKSFKADCPVKSISVDYPVRRSKTSGSDWWVIYFFVASMAFAFILKPFFNVRI